MHAPCAQVPPLGQARSQAPQCAVLLLVSAQASPHSSVSCGHTHCPALQLAASGQARSQEPQCAASVAKFAQSEPQTCCPVGHTQAPLAQAAASGHFVAQSPQCEALLCVSTHWLPQATPLLHISVAPPVPAPSSSVLPAAPPVPAPDLNKSREPLPQWTSPRAASRSTRQRRATCAALLAEPPPRCFLDRLGIDIEDGRISVEAQAGSSCSAGSIPRAATRSRCFSSSIDVPRLFHRKPSKTLRGQFRSPGRFPDIAAGCSLRDK
jgi:hypothetical protein